MEEYLSSMYLMNIERDYNYLTNKKMREFNIGKHDVRVLKVINANEGISQNNICSIINEDKITVSKAVKNLEQNGYIEKRKDSDDKRITRLFMTEEGINKREHLLEILNYLNNTLVKDLSDEEVDYFNKILKKVSKNISKEALRLNED